MNVKLANADASDDGESKCLPNVAWDPLPGTGWGRTSFATLPGLPVRITMWTELTGADLLSQDHGTDAARNIINRAVRFGQNTTCPNNNTHTLTKHTSGLD